MQIANNYDEFVKKVTDAEMEMLNGDAGQELVQKLLEMKLASNPHLTVKEIVLTLMTENELDEGAGGYDRGYYEGYDDALVDVLTALKIPHDLTYHN